MRTDKQKRNWRDAARFTVRRSNEFGQWRARNKLGSGGNGEVWLCTNNAGRECAVKVLTKVKQIAYGRFRDEIAVLRSNSDIQGILQIGDSDLPEMSSGRVPWYSMPLAQPLERWAKTVSAYRKVLAISEAADTLAALHKRSIFHRDLKPANLVYFENRCHVVDFGLVEYPGKADLTQKGEKLGPLWTMAPEVRRNGASADPGPADVYSLAKSLWIILKNVPNGFDGQYSPTGKLAIQGACADLYISPLEEALTKATANDSTDRPSMESFCTSLREWAILQQDYARRNPLVWRELLKDLFPFAVPRQASWTDTDLIVSILNRLGKSNSLNHTFFPDGGGMDLDGAIVSASEPGCIELDLSRAHIVKPRKLTFEGYSEDPDWNYFRLELDDLQSCGAFTGGVGKWDEQGTEISPGKYAPPSCWDNNEYRGRPLPAGARPIVRCFRGTFLIVSKTSIYNFATGELDGYDGKHNKMSEGQFRAFMDNYRDAAINANFNPLKERERRARRRLSSAIDLDD